MLNTLSIKNVAVIDSLEIDMKKGLSVLTGETGAGKSIIIDSINMILGVRADRELVRRGTEKATVEAIFSADDDVIGILEENDIDVDDDQIIITRRLSSDGKSVARINGTTVTLNLLREIADKLINIHGQHDNQALLNPAMHITFLDEFAKINTHLDKYKELYHKMHSIKKEIERLSINESQKQQKIDMLTYQINEINSAKLVEGEDEELKNSREIYNNAEKISVAINTAYTNLYDNSDGQSAYDGLSLAVKALSEISELNPDVKAAYDELSGMVYSIEDTAHSLKEFSDTVEYDEAVLNDIEDRLETISKLKRKYGNSIEEIIKFGQDAQKQLDDIVLSDEKIEELNNLLDEAVLELKAAGEKLSKERKKAAVELKSKIEASLHELNMEKARFDISITPKKDFSEDGVDDVEFLISTNPGDELKPLVKIASGGELSRIMLAMKSVLAYSDKVDTLIFDEIDTGVSGAAAIKIADKLKETAKAKQVICITHLPQVAAAADVHYLIKKNVDGESAVTGVEELDIEGRIAELSRIIDGGRASEISREHAKQMLGI